MPQRRPENPEHQMMDMLRRLAFAKGTGSPIAYEEALYAKSYREKGSWNWMGLGRVIWLWYVAHWGSATDRGEAMKSAEDWFLRQLREGHMCNEMLTASHYELYLAIAAAARKLARKAGLARLADLAAEWWLRQEAITALCWVAEDDGGNMLAPHARAGHGGVSQGVAVCHQLFRDLPLAGPAQKPAWWDAEDMLGPAILRQLLAEGDDFAVMLDGVKYTALAATIGDLPPNRPLLMNRVTVERGPGYFRAYVTEWIAGADACRWVFWSTPAGRQMEWLGRPANRIGPMPTRPAPPTSSYRLGPEGWEVWDGMHSDQPAWETPEEGGGPDPPGQPVKPPRVGPGDLARPDPLDPARELADRMRAFAETKPAAKAGIRGFAAEIEERFGEAGP